MSVSSSVEIPRLFPTVRAAPILGVTVHLLSAHELNALIRIAVDAKKQIIIANHNLHSIALYHRDERMRDFFAQTDFVHIDGMPLVWWGRLLGFCVLRKHRVTYLDWLPLLMSEAVREGWRVFYLGAKPGVAEQGAAILKKRYAGLSIHAAHGYFDVQPGSIENERVIEAINTFAPQVLMVGMGMPRQERWILDNMDRLQVNVLLPAGACIDYVAGDVPTPPRWLGQVGLEWAYRLLAEPRRLARRYLAEPWGLIRYATGDLFSHVRASKHGRISANDP